MKKLFLSFALLVVSLSSGCTNAFVENRRLSVPIPSFTENEYTVVWDSIDGAVSYTVSVNGEEYETEDNFFILDFLSTKEFYVKVKANGQKPQTFDSEYSATVYKNYGKGK